MRLHALPETLTHEDQGPGRPTISASEILLPVQTYQDYASHLANRPADPTDAHYGPGPV
jgi:hypothetical protein